jgi:plastocyanin
MAGALLAAALPLAACGGGGTSKASANDTVAAAPTATTASVPEVVIQIADNSFTPETVTIAPGTKVVWKWSGSNPHAVLINGEKSAEMTGSGTFEKVFRGGSTTIAYQCAVHGAAMSGKIVIQ